MNEWNENEIYNIKYKIIEVIVLKQKEDSWEYCPYFIKQPYTTIKLPIDATPAGFSVCASLWP